MLSKRTSKYQFYSLWFDLLAFEPTIYHTRGEHANIPQMRFNSYSGLWPQNDCCVKVRLQGLRCVVLSLDTFTFVHETVIQSFKLYCSVYSLILNIKMFESYFAVFNGKIVHLILTDFFLNVNALSDMLTWTWKLLSHIKWSVYQFETWPPLIITHDDDHHQHSSIQGLRNVLKYTCRQVTNQFERCTRLILSCQSLFTFRYRDNHL